MLVLLFINLCDGLLVISGLMSVDFVCELCVSYGVFFFCIVVIIFNVGVYVLEIFCVGI